MRSARDSANAWRRARHIKLLSTRPQFGDHLTSTVFLAMNTGLRRGEILKLRWSSVDFDPRLLTIEGGMAKNRQTRRVPLNDDATSMLTRWRERSGHEPRVSDIISPRAWSRSVCH